MPSRKPPIANPNRIPNTRFQRVLARMNACKDARLWVGSRTLAQAWAEAEHSSWMGFLVKGLGLVSCTCGDRVGGFAKVDCPLYLLYSTSPNELRRLYTPTLALAEAKFPPPPRLKKAA